MATNKLMHVMRIPRHIRAKTMNILSWSAETWRSVLEVVSIIAGVFTLMAGAIGVGALIGITIADRFIKKAQARENEEKTARILTLERETADAKRKLLETEKVMSRRAIPFIVKDGKTNLDGLKPFAGIKVIIEYAPEAEPYRAADDLRQALARAGFEVLSFTPVAFLVEPFWDGVVVQPHVPRPPASLEQARTQPDTTQKSGDAADGVVRFLESNNWVARYFPSKFDELPPDTLRIRVGFKPEPYRLTEEVEEMFKRHKLAGWPPKRKE